jgi:hypothetical protein
MKLDAIISSIDRDITYHEKQLTSIKNKREKLVDLAKLYPDMKCENNVYCLPSIWDKVSCMRLDRARNGYSYSSMNIVARFSVGSRDLIAGMKIHTDPYSNIIATINYPYKGSKTIEIFDYSKLIPDICPKKSRFVKRIRSRIIQTISNSQLDITANSFDKANIEKLILLR